MVTHRVAWLLEQGIPGQHVLALTFTNKAADEMSRRIERLTGDPTVWVGTFHRFCARLLRKYASLVGLQENYTIYDTDDSHQAMRQALARLRIDAERFTPDRIAKAISWAKNNLIAPDQYKPRPGHALGQVVEAVYPAYQAQLAQSNAADFDDLLFHVATLLRDNPEVRASLDERYRFILVDEYQDTNLAQYAIARALSVDHPNLAVTGDPDQSIYGWRGANLNNILEFERDFPEVHVVRLEQNYRSTQRILRVAAELIAHNIRRKVKGLFTDNGQGVPVRLVTYATQRDEAEGIAARIAADVAAGRRRPCDFAIFYRVNALSRAFEFALRERGVPYQMVNGLEFFQRKEIKDILSYLHLLNNPQDGVALRRVINTPPRGIGKTTIDRLSDYAARHGLPLLEAATAGKAHRVDQSPARGVARTVRRVVRSPLGGRCRADRRDSGARADRNRLSEAVAGVGRRRRPAAAGQHRGIVHRGPRFRRAAGRSRPIGSIFGRNQPGERHRRLGDRRRPGHADDAARLEGTGVSGGLPDGRRGGDFAARAQPRTSRATRRRAAADVRRHHPGAAGASDQHGPIPRLPRPAEADDPQFVSHGIAAGRNGGGLGRRRGSDGRVVA